MKNEQRKTQSGASMPDSHRKQNLAAVQSENSVYADLIKPAEMNLVDLTEYYIKIINIVPDIKIVDTIHEISAECSRQRSFEWILIGACVFRLVNGAAQSGGRGQTDIDESGCISIYKCLGKIFDLSWKIIAENASLYRKFFVERIITLTDASPETIRRKRRELLFEIFALGKMFYRIAAKTTDPESAIKLACEKKSANPNARYTTCQFETDLVERELLQVSTNDFTKSGNDGNSNLIKMNFELDYEIVEMIEVLSVSLSLPREGVLKEAVKSLFTNKIPADANGGESND